MSYMDNIIYYVENKIQNKKLKIKHFCAYRELKKNVWFSIVYIPIENVFLILI